jgi:hypothetical protein
MKHYIKSYLWKHSITFDVQLQKKPKRNTYSKTTAQGQPCKISK